MKFAVASALALAAVSSAQFDISKLPSCAKTCLGQLTTGKKIGGCNQLDIPCVCKSGDFIGTIACCVKKECDEEGQKNVLTFAKGVCGSVGVETPDTPGGIADLCKDDKGSSSSKSAATADATKSDAGAATTSSPSETKASGESAPTTTSKAGAVVNGASGVLGAIAAALMAL